MTMSEQSNFSKYFSLLKQPSSAFRNRDHVFTISHMRARTTLLSHIMGNHPEVCGHNELHISYRSNFDLFRLKAQLQNEEKFTSARYLHDKLLHNRLELNTGLITPPHNKLIVVIREPITSLNSMAKMHMKVWGNKNYKHLDQYYINRINWILENISGTDCFYINSDDFVNQAEKVLADLSLYLELQSILSPNYETFEDTGTEGKGDPSKNIQAGKIIQTNSDREEIFEFDYQKAIDAHEKFVENFRCINR